MTHPMMTVSRCTEPNGHGLTRMWHGREARVAHMRMVPLVVGGWLVYAAGMSMGIVAGVMMARKRHMAMHGMRGMGAMRGGPCCPEEPRVSADDDER